MKGHSSDLAKVKGEVDAEKSKSRELAKQLSEKISKLEAELAAAKAAKSTQDCVTQIGAPSKTVAADKDIGICTKNSHFASEGRRRALSQS